LRCGVALIQLAPCRGGDIMLRIWGNAVAEFFRLSWREAMEDWDGRQW
jgi:hypothetical protein